jgi:outer membrane protein
MLQFPAMKKFRFVILAALLMAVACSASAQTKIATVDVGKLLKGYYKTRMAENALEKKKDDLRKELKDMADGLDKAKTDYKALLDQANDPAISSDERDRRKQAANDKVREINNSQAALEQFDRQAQAQLTDQSQRMRTGLLTEIQTAVSDKAKAAGYTLVVNSANPEIVLYANDQGDITDAVLKQLNAGAPIDVTQPGGSLMGTNSP